MFSVVSIILLCQAVQYSAGTECLSCSNVENPTDCSHHITCNHDEVCAMHHYLTESGASMYDYGCSASQACLHSIGSIFGRRDEGHHIICTECCNNTRLCNADLQCKDDVASHDLPRECSDVKMASQKSGVYTIYPYGTPHHAVSVYCEVESSGQIWTVIQRRYNGSVQFYRDWQDYKNGFGYPNGEYWLGNDIIHELTSHAIHILKIVMTDFDGVTKVAEYSVFHVGDEDNGYKLLVDHYNGTAGDSLSYHSGHKFTTYDRDNDIPTGNCAVTFKGAWWYFNCHYSNLNGVYLAGHHDEYATGINWYAWHGYYYSLKSTEMMIRKT